MDANVEKKLNAAHDALIKRLHEQVQWLCEQAWPSQLEHWLNELNESLKAGVKLEVTHTDPFTEVEIKELVEKLHPLRTLKMKDEIREILVETLEKKGLETNVFHPKPKKESPPAAPLN
jgi:hypothetical protein